MKKIFLAVVILLALTLSACQNNGHIGWIFGVWRVNEYIADGVRQTDPLISRCTLAFQGDVVEVVAIPDEYQTRITRNGTWAENGNDFTLDFTHSDDWRPSGTGLYEAPAWLGMTSQAPMHMTISERTSDKFTLTWEDSEGVLKVYKLQKTW